MALYLVVVVAVGIFCVTTYLGDVVPSNIGLKMGL